MKLARDPYMVLSPRDDMIRTYLDKWATAPTFTSP